MHKRLVMLLLAAVALGAAYRSAQAQAPTPSDDDVNRVARQLFCPVCQNIPLDVCPTEACAKWRDTIREKLGAGWTDQQVIDYFVAQYGERVLANPSGRGLNLMIWVIPPVALLIGVAVLWRFFRSAAPLAAPAAPPAEPTAPTDKYVAQLEKELEKRR